ncbi:MAG: PAS domain-containing sensor histidine kinase [Nitrososphaerota archaeon]|nr:PAS domain-containing sensor histidine kinase [Candidatus Bathyarchaeota archaeon]MDW8194416.1 PAS domain-containing sensor histidine kinase [Nitrososphaerota archaeon]
MKTPVQNGEEAYEWQKTFNAIPDLVFILDRNYNFIKVNKAAYEFWEIKPQELVGKTCYKVVRGRDEPCPECPNIKVLETKSSVTMEQPSYRKSDRILLVKVSPIFDENGEIVKFIHVGRDITRYKEVENALRASEETYRQLFNGMNDTAWVINHDGRFIDVNDAATRVLGYTREELLNMRVPQIDGSLTDEMIMELIRRMPADKIQVFETTHITKDGRIIPVEISSSLINYKGKRVILSIARDITERKKTEERINQIMEALRLANEKLSVVGKWARHDARNKLSVIKSNIYLAKRKLPSDHPVQKYLEDVESTCDQIVKIFDFASAYEMLGVEERVYVDVTKMFNEAMSLILGVENVQVINECHGLKVLADSQLRQLFYNMIENSLKHGEKVTQIRVYYITYGEDLKLIYEDNGVGIPDEIRPNLFKEGYGKGTGYGLYLTKKLCELYGWDINETGKYGQGVQFTMIIPQKDAKGNILYKIQKI